jgi:hypothetical protein
VQRCDYIISPDEVVPIDYRNLNNGGKQGALQTRWLAFNQNILIIAGYLIIQISSESIIE